MLRIVADNAGDLINEITMMMTHKLGLGKLTDVIHPYPTVTTNQFVKLGRKMCQFFYPKKGYRSFF